VPDNHYPQPAPNSIDVDAVIRRARRRRAPRTVGVALVTAVAAVAVVGVGVIGLTHLPVQSSASSSDAGAKAQGTPDTVSGAPSPVGGARATCGQPSPTAPPSQGALVGSLKISSDSPSGMEASVTLTNTGSSPVHGTDASAVIVVIRDGMVVAVSTWGEAGGSGPPGAINLATGHSLELGGISFPPVGCSGVPLAAGAYQIFGEGMVKTAGMADVEIIRTPLTTVTLH
jgi:hypothetical protein